MIVFSAARTLVVAFLLGSLATLYLTHEMTPAAPPAAHQVRPGSGPLGLHSGPGLDYPTVASLPEGTAIDLRCWVAARLAQASAMWVKVAAGSISGWVNGAGLDLDLPTLADPTGHRLPSC